MKFRTLLLSSATAFSVVGGAQAADLTVAEPVDYVKVCDAFGVGYWYIPGTDTCLKIGGYVRFDVNVHSDKLILSGTTTTTALYGSVVTNVQTLTTVVGTITATILTNALFGSAVTGFSTASSNWHSGGYDFVTKTYLTASAKSMTDYGPLTGYIAWQAVYDPSSSINSLVQIDEAYLSLGPLLAGKTASTYDYSGGLTYDGSSLDSDTGVNQVRLSWAMNGFGLMFGVEDARFRWGSVETDDMPDLVAAITASSGPFDAKLSFGYADLVTGGGWGAQAAATVKLDQIAPGDLFRVKVAYAEDAYSFAGGGATGFTKTTGAYWSALASFKHFFTPSVYGAVTYDYLSDPVGDSWQATGQITWLPARNFQVGFEAGYKDSDYVSTWNDQWFGKIRFQRDWGG